MKLYLAFSFHFIFSLEMLGNITFDFLTSRNLFTSSYAVAVGDINNDGLQDIVTSLYIEDKDQMKILVYLQNNDNQIIDSPIVYHFLNNGNAISDISIADLNNDGLNDIVVGRFGNGSNSLGIFFQNVSTNLLNPIEFLDNTYNVIKIVTADLNNDGLNDIVLNVSNGNLSVYYQTDSFFHKVSYQNVCCDIVVADINNDGLNDIVAAGGSFQTSFWVYLQDSVSGLLSSRQSYGIPISLRFFHGLSVGDLNNDGLNDVAIASGSGNDHEVIIWYNNVNNIFTPTIISVDHYPRGIEIADLNCDGHKDLTILHNQGNGISFYDSLFIGSYRYYKHNPINNTSGYNFWSFGDINNDGKKDLSIVGTTLMGTKLVVSKNISTQGNEYFIDTTTVCQIPVIDDYYPTYDSIHTSYDTIDNAFIRTTKIYSVNIAYKASITSCMDSISIYDCDYHILPTKRFFEIIDTLSLSKEVLLVSETVDTLTINSIETSNTCNKMFFYTNSNIKFNNDCIEYYNEVQLSIFNIEGKVIFQSNYTGNRIEVNIDNLGVGLYYIIIISEEHYLYKKFFKY